MYYNQIYNFDCQFFLSCLTPTSSNDCFVVQWFVVMSTQLIGFSIGGILRRFLVQPPSMIWPLNLVNCALFNTLHSQQYAGIGTYGGISRERYFLYVFIGSFSWCKLQATVSDLVTNPMYRTLQRLLPRISL